MGVELGGDLGWVADQPFGELVGQGRDPVHHDKWVSNDGCLYGGSATGYDAGSGVVQGFAGVGDEAEIGERLEVNSARKIPQARLCLRGYPGGSRVDATGRRNSYWSLRKDAPSSMVGRLWRRTSFSWLPGRIAIQSLAGFVAAGRVLAGDGGQGKLGEGMANESGIDAAGTVKALFERKYNHHMRLTCSCTQRRRLRFHGSELGLTK